MPREVRSRDRFAREHAGPHNLKPRCRVWGGPYPHPKKECAATFAGPYVLRRLVETMQGAA